MLKESVDWILFSLFNLSEGSHIAESLHFFLYDTIKILILLFIMISVVGFLRTYLPHHKIKKLLAGKKKGLGNVTASLLGAVTPFCSCSSIPLFISFLEAEIPLGVTFSFLITSPLINEYVVIIMWGFFGWKITLLYVLSGLLIGTFAGMILGKLKLEKHIEKDLITKDSEVDKEVKHHTMSERVHYGIHEAYSIINKIWLWVLVGVGIGAALHGFVPEGTIHSIISKGGIFTVPIAAILGVPLYANCGAVVPIAVVLFQKGVPLGTALSFMMATAALSFPEAVILRRVMKLKLIGIFFGIVTLAIVITGYLFNVLQSIIA